MKLNLRFKDYVGLLRGSSNEAVHVDRLTAPFGLTYSNEPSEDLLVGHVLDDLSLQFGPEDAIDCLDVAESAWALGHESAGAFLLAAPGLVGTAISQRIKDSAGSTGCH